MDPEADAVEVWTFDDPDGPRHARFTDRLPVRLAGEDLGTVDLAAVFRR